MSHYLIVTDVLSIDPSLQLVNITADMYEVGSTTNYVTAIPFTLAIPTPSNPVDIQASYYQQLSSIMATNLPTNNTDSTSTYSFLGLNFSAAWAAPIIFGKLLK